MDDYLNLITKMLMIGKPPKPLPLHVLIERLDLDRIKPIDILINKQLKELELEGIKQDAINFIKLKERNYKEKKELSDIINSLLDEEEKNEHDLNDFLNRKKEFDLINKKFFNRK